MWQNSSELLKEKVQNLEPLPLPQVLVTTGFPVEELILTTQEVDAKGLDIVKLGMPSSAVVTDRALIHHPSNITFQGNMFSERLLGLLRHFRDQGLKAPVVLLGLIAQRMKAYCRVERPINPIGTRGRFGDFGGKYVPEPLVDCLVVLEAAHKSAMADPEFHKVLQSHFGYINRPSQMYLAQNLTDEAGGANIWLKREDLNHTGSHHINNAIGQILLARRLGKTRIIAETGSGQHGVATATICAKFGMECVVYMGSEDVRRQSLNVLKMDMLGAKVIPVTSGSRKLKDAINEAFRDLVTNLSDTYYLIGSAIGPHPFPTIVRDFQNIISQEIKTQMNATRGKLPDAVVACVGGGGNAIGAFYEFINDEGVRLIGVEAGGEGRHTNVSDPRTSGASASLAIGRPGVFHGMKTYVIQSKTGQIIDTHSIAAGLDYPAVGPEHAWLKDSGRAEYVVATDEDALQGFRMLTRREGIIPALESSHAIWYAVQLAKNLDRDKDVVVCLSGSGDKDVEHIATTSFK